MEVRQVNITLLKERKLASVYEKQKNPLNCFIWCRTTDRWLISFLFFHFQLIPLMFCKCWSCQRTWRGCPWRLVSAPAGETQRRQTWPTGSKRSSSVLPPNSSSLVMGYFFSYKTLYRVVFQCNLKKETPWEVWTNSTYCSSWADVFHWQ